MIWLLWVALLVAGLLTWAARAGRRPRAPEPLDERDRLELEAAEEEVRRLDAGHRPDEGWEGDDWGPGAPKGT